jgi:diacylglycerol kinase (ATP)
MPEWKNASLWNKFSYSCNGLRVAFLAERSFRQEAFASALLTLGAIFLTGNVLKVLLVLLLSLFPMALELVNAAVEMLIDNHVGTNWREDIRRTKDMLSASVFMGLVIGYVGSLIVILS